MNIEQDIVFSAATSEGCIWSFRGTCSGWNAVAIVREYQSYSAPGQEMDTRMHRGWSVEDKTACM